MTTAFDESSCLGLQLKMGGKFHLKLNIGERPIANKYREGKMKRTLKRELKVLKLLKGKRLETSDLRLSLHCARWLLAWCHCSSGVAGVSQSVCERCWDKVACWECSSASSGECLIALQCV